MVNGEDAKYADCVCVPGGKEKTINWAFCLCLISVQLVWLSIVATLRGCTLLNSVAKKNKKKTCEINASDVSLLSEVNIEHFSDLSHYRINAT